MVKLETIKFTKALQKSQGDQYLVAMSIDIFNDVFFGGNGVFNRQARTQSSRWKPLRKRYEERKRKNGLSTNPWNRTGTFLENMRKSMTTLKQDGKKITYKSRSKKASLDVSGAIGKAKGDKSKNVRTKRAIFWGNQRRRPFAAYTQQDIERALDSSAKSLGEIFQKVGVK